MSRPLPTHRLGYAVGSEDRGYLNSAGLDPRLMLKAAREFKPSLNVNTHPMVLFDPLNQGNQGACQGHALAMMFTICYFLLTGRVEMFSRAAAYYWSQQEDGIRGDRGSTLSGGRKVAAKGLPLESEWRYPSRYDPREPAGIQNRRRFKLVASKPTQDIEQIREALDLGLPVQDGIIWDASVSRTLSTDYRGSGGGGHSTTLWTKKDDDYRRINSWGMWDGDGCNENTPRSLKQQVEHRYSSHVIYAPEGMIYPDLAPVNLI